MSVAPEQHLRLTRALASARQDVADGRAPTWADGRTHDPLTELERLLEVFAVADRAASVRGVRGPAIAGVLEQARAVYRAASEPGNAGARVGELYADSFAKLSSASGYELLLDAMLDAARLSALDDELAPWFGLPELPFDHLRVRSVPAWLRIVARLLAAWGEWEQLGFEHGSLASSLRASLEATVFVEWQAQSPDDWLRAVAIASALDNLLAARELACIGLSEHELAVAVVANVRAKLDAVEEPAEQDVEDEGELWAHVWALSKRCSDVELARAAYRGFVAYTQTIHDSQSYTWVIDSPASHMPELLAEHLCSYCEWDPELRDEHEEGVGVLGKFPRTIDPARSSAHFAAAIRLAAAALRILDLGYFKPQASAVAIEALERLHAQLEPLRERFAGSSAAGSLEELILALDELLRG